MSAADTKDNIDRLFDELHAAPTRSEAVDVFYGADWIFVHMNPAKRERLYEKIDDIINGKPE